MLSGKSNLYQVNITIITIWWFTKLRHKERMQWLHHSLCLGMEKQQIQELARITVKRHLLKKQ